MFFISELARNVVKALQLCLPYRDLDIFEQLKCGIDLIPRTSHQKPAEHLINHEYHAVFACVAIGSRLSLQCNVSYLKIFLVRTI